MNEVGKIIASKRKEAGLTQAQLSELLFVSDKTVSRWETGASMPDITILPSLCKALNISMEQLLGETEESPKEAKNNEPVIWRNLFWILCAAVLFVLAGIVGGNRIKMQLDDVDYDASRAYAVYMSEYGRDDLDKWQRLISHSEEKIKALTEYLQDQKYVRQLSSIGPYHGDYMYFSIFAGGRENEIYLLRPYLVINGKNYQLLENDEIFTLVENVERNLSFVSVERLEEKQNVPLSEKEVISINSCLNKIHLTTDSIEPSDLAGWQLLQGETAGGEKYLLYACDSYIAVGGRVYRR